MRSRRMGLRVRNDGSTAAPQNPDVVRITGIRDYVDMHTALRLYFDVVLCHIILFRIH